MKDTVARTVFAAALVLAGLAVLTQVACNAESRKRSLVETGNKYFASGKYREATLVYSKAIQLDGRYGEAHYRLGLAQIRLGQVAPAMRSLRRACELQPNNEDAFSKLGDLYLAVYLANPGRNQQYLNDFGELADSILRHDPKSFDGLRLKGYHLMGQSKLKEAIESFEAANRVKPNQGNVVVVLAQALSAANSFPQAEKMLLDFLNTEKGFAPAYDYLYVQYLSRKRLDDAVVLLRRKVENNPKNAEFLIQLASHYLAVNDEGRANETIERLTSNPTDFPNGRMTAGDHFYRLRRFDKAMEHYQAGASANAANALAYRKKIVECLYAQGNKEGALKLVLDLHNDHAGDPEVKALRAAMRLQSGNLKEIQTAAVELQAAVSRIPDNPTLRFRLAEALIAKGELDQARQQLEEAIKTQPSYMAPRYLLGSLHLGRRDFNRAQSIANEILSVTPGDINARLIRSAALMGLNDFQKAREELEVLLRARSDLPQAVFLLASLDFSQRRFAAAESGFRKLQQLNDPRGIGGVAESLMAQNRASEAQQVVQAALQKSPDARDLRLLHAKTATAVGQFELALTELSQVLATAPDSPDLHLMIGQTHRQAGRLQEAEAAFLRARKLAPTRVEPITSLALLYEAMKEPGKAKPMYEEMLKLSPDNAIALNNLAYILAESGENLDQALKYALRAKQKYPQDNDIADTLGWIYIRKNLSDNAVQIFKELVGKNPHHPTWRYHLAMALYQKGDRPSARRELEAALRAKPSKDEEGKIRELLAKTGA
jgi:tetratricopeptide (TPR) repeat protein